MDSKGSLALIDEITELLNEVNYKWWKNPKEVDDNAVKEEIVDMLHFFVSICLYAGVSAKDLYDAYIEKIKKILTDKTVCQKERIRIKIA